jgi:hypothetical protein
MAPPSLQFESRLALWESDGTLLEPNQFRRRMEILDQLDALIPDADPSGPRSAPDLLSRAQAFSSYLDSANTQLFNSIRSQIQTGICPTEFQALLRDSSESPHGLAYDYLDDLVAGVFQFEPLTKEPLTLDPDSVFYQPTPARHIFHLITAAAINRTDTLIDLGSGLGHVSLLASICTGATTVGIELDPAWIASAKNCAGNLSLSNVSFLAQDARVANLSSGTVFYLYTPFTGSTLATVLDALRGQSLLRPIRICTFGPCTLSVGNQRWLTPLTPPANDRITVFLPRP